MFSDDDDDGHIINIYKHYFKWLLNSLCGHKFSDDFLEKNVTLRLKRKTTTETMTVNNHDQEPVKEGVPCIDELNNVVKLIMIFNYFIGFVMKLM